MLHDRSGGGPPSIVSEHILPRYETLATEGAALVAAINADCQPESDTRRDASGRAFDAWVAVSHLRVGRSEKDERVFKLAFLPGAAPRLKASQT